MRLDKDSSNLTGIENNEVWLSTEEVIPLEEVSKNGFWKRFQGYRYTYRYVASTNGGRGGKKIEIALSSLSPEGQRRYLDQLYNNRHVTTKELAEKFNLRIPPEKMQDPKTASMVRMIVECMAVPAGARGRKERIKEIAEGYGWHVGSAYRLLERVERGQPLGARRKAQGVRLEELGITVRAWDEKAARMAVGMVLENRRRQITGGDLYQYVKDTAKAEGLRIGSYRSFMIIKKRIDGTPLAVFRDKGRQGLRQDVHPPIRRDPTAYRPMEVLIGDQHKADYYAFNSSGRVVTLELFVWMDFRTQLVWGSVAYQHYNRFTVGRALTNAVRWGLPSTVYTDWGKPEKSNYLTHLVQQLTGIGIKTESIEHVLATGRHPQAKPIEGFFSHFDPMLRNAGIPGYMKRLKDPRESELQRKEINELIKSQKLLKVEELTGKLLAELEQWNIHVFKNRCADEDQGRSPLDIYREEIKQHPVTTLSDEMLEYIFLPVRKVMIKRSSVSFRHEWLGKKVYYDRALADYQGMKAEVRYDPFDPWRAWVFVEGALICEAEEWGMINPKISDQVAEKMAEQKRLERHVVETYRKLQPPKAPVRRINPAEREARQMRNEKTVRVMETSLEKAQGAWRMAHGGGGSALDAFRSQFHPGAGPQQPEEGAPRRRLFALSMKQMNHEKEGD